MRAFQFALWCSTLLATSQAFQPFAPIATSFVRRNTNLEAFASYEELTDIGFTVSVEKPLGVVFGVNRQPYSGLAVDHVEAGKNGAMAGLKRGDQLLTVNGQAVIGSDFETTMELLRQADDTLELQMFRGTADTLYTQLLNKRGSIEGEEESEPEYVEEQVIMDENYESPVQISIEELEDEKPVDYMKAFKKIGETMTGGGDKKKGGLFSGMFSGETVQLEGDDASTIN